MKEVNSDSNTFSLIHDKYELHESKRNNSDVYVWISKRDICET